MPRLGHGTAVVCEAAVHAARRICLKLSPGHVLVKIDMKNTNIVRRAHIANSSRV